MDQAAAQHKIRKLEALANDPAATPGEAATARRMAQRLRDRHQIRDAPHPPPRAAPAGGFTMTGSREAFIKAFDDAMSDFNPNTGETRSNRVTVKYWTNRGNWRIELDI